MSDGKSAGLIAGKIRLRGEDIPTETRDIEQNKLKFYVDNPRIYSLLRINGHVPEQEEIWEQLLEHEHVRVLKDDIVANDGLMDPLIVRDGDLVVLEGNSRLAAYRFLATKDPIRWAKVRCTVLPADIDEKLIFALLGQYHVKGKKDWAPFEKAGFLYRRYKDHGLELSAVAAELGIVIGEARHLVSVYEFMLEHDETDREHWSYYDEYLKSNRIKKARQEHAGFDAFIVDQIKSGQIPKAMDLRDKLPTICVGPTKILRRYIEKKVDFSEAYDDTVDAGADNYALKKLRKFREWLVISDTEDDLLESSKPIRDKMLFELKEIEKKARKLRDVLETAKSNM
jgi:ParB-like nuclease domain